MKFIGIAGGSGSGKTTFAKLLADKLGSKRVSILAQDNYYIDQSQNFDRDGGSVNFDHPDAIDWDLLVSHIRLLRDGRTIEMPIYNFSDHKRKNEIILVEPKEFILVDGILLFSCEALLNELDFKIFIDASEEVRYSRRLHRDVRERGRTPEGVKAQFASQVKPMHDQFVEPSKAHADLVISGEANFEPRLSQVISWLQ